eukprot:1995156-Pleurochrysis_carterae.AAC.1
MLTYFSQCQAFDPTTGSAHANAGRYTCDAAALRALLKGKFAEIDWLNSPFGALTLKQLVTRSKFNPVGQSEMYTLLSSLDEVAHFGGKTFAALGYTQYSPKGGSRSKRLWRIKRSLSSSTTTWVRSSVSPASR